MIHDFFRKSCYHRRVGLRPSPPPSDDKIYSIYIILINRRNNLDFT